MKRKLQVLLICGLLITLIVGCAKSDSDTPVTVTIWHYYNGAQLEAFDSLVSEFNDTVGKEKGIIVESSSQGSVSDLETNVLKSANQEVGAEEVPNIFAAYADTAYAVDQLGLVVDISKYLSKEEKEKFIDSYLEEGAFPDSDNLKIFPVAKSTEVYMLNNTDWEKFASATGTQLDELGTVEGVTAVAEKYYEWTDSLTPELNDGRAFFGRDAVANYYIVGSKQLGKEVFSVQKGKAVLNFDKDIARKLWDNYYTPYIKGYVDATGRFRSDDIKTGNIISFVGSNSGATFFPKEVILSDTESYPIEMQVLPAPIFEGGESVAVQQGAGMVVTKTEDTDEREVVASLEFLKWFVQDERNIKFSVSSGYLPVTKSANDVDKINTNMKDTEKVTNSIIKTAIETVNTNEMYTPKAFGNGTEARNILEHSMADLAKADREKVIAHLSEGMTLAEAVSEFTTDAYFDAWYTQTEKKLKELVK